MWLNQNQYSQLHLYQHYDFWKEESLVTRCVYLLTLRFPEKTPWSNTYCLINSFIQYELASGICLQDKAEALMIKSFTDNLYSAFPSSFNSLRSLEEMELKFALYTRVSDRVIQVLYVMYNDPGIQWKTTDCITQNEKIIHIWKRQ